MRRGFSAGILFLFSNRQIPKGIENKTLRLILPGAASLGGEVIGILRLLIEIGGVVGGFRERVARGKFQVFVHLAGEGERKAVVSRGRGILELIDVVEPRIEALSGKDLASKLLEGGS